MNRLDRVEDTQLRKNLPRFQPGDTVRVHVRIKESETKERLQAFIDGSKCKSMQLMSYHGHQH